MDEAYGLMEGHFHINGNQPWREALVEPNDSFGCRVSSTHFSVLRLSQAFKIFFDIGESLFTILVNYGQLMWGSQMPVSKLSHPELITKSAGVTVTYNREMFNYLLSLIPTPDFYVELHERYAASFADSLKGDPEKIKACEADRQLIDQNLSILFGLAKVVTAKDPSVMESFGLNRSAVKTAVFAAVLERPKDFRVSFDKKGHPQVSLTKIMGAKGYEVWACDADPSSEENWRLVVWSTKCQSIPITGLNRTQLNWLRIRGKRGDIVGPWSHPITLSP